MHVNYTSPEGCRAELISVEIYHCNFSWGAGGGGVKVVKVGLCSNQKAENGERHLNVNLAADRVSESSCFLFFLQSKVFVVVMLV